VSKSSWELGGLVGVREKRKRLSKSFELTKFLLTIHFYSLNFPSFHFFSNYAIIYLFLEAFAIVYGPEGYNLGTAKSSLPFFGVLIGFVLAFGLYYYQLKYENYAAKKSLSTSQELELQNGGQISTNLNGTSVDLETPPEARLMWLLPAGILFPISLFWFAWTSMPEVPVMVSVVAAGAFGLSSHMIFIAVSSYTIVSYGSYAASGECLERERRSF